ncbi:hypothetical protein MSR1_16080 [Magnetospirillum gryphiswaldense MSR-1]|nr:hypothetical protein MSR1_16080 [Magnetospirillum gryphiswaldense MSR-1]AVM78003.1 hypothetical protein MSR1L_16080 [Magnetospirillum gryphiswaldense]
MGNRDVSFHMKDAAVVTVGEGTGREVLVNPSFNAALLLEGWPSNERMLALIEGFERALYPAVRSLLKARRGDITIDKDSNIILDAPYFFSGYHQADRTALIEDDHSGGVVMIDGIHAEDMP